ncbi:retrotransposon protein [Cucumis melo var. makuwa]|uniref:Retrotransposon protein n=1 Tax=Cucumis melo var. makuwa TaxID=1194695 RepID=A0A5D3DGU6_CUCMM|nr:retrotransposon protein [Cucumis melo var. makuwa]
MDRQTFTILCHLLRTVAGLSQIEIVDVEEMVAMFLHVLAHDVKNHIIQRDIVQSGKTVSRHYNLVLLVVLRLHDESIKKPILVTNNYNDQSWKCFKNSIEALDETYIKVNVPVADHPTFRMRKGEIATNVLGVCDTKEDLVYVLTSCKGSREDLLILRDALVTQTLRDFSPHTEASDTTWKSVVVPKMLMTTSSRAPKHVWKKQQKDTFVECLVELVSIGGWKSDNCDRATGHFTMTFVDVRSNESVRYEEFDMPDGNEEFHPYIARGLTCPRRMYAHHDL